MCVHMWVCIWGTASIGLWALFSLLMHSSEDLLCAQNCEVQDPCCPWQPLFPGNSGSEPSLEAGLALALLCLNGGTIYSGQDLCWGHSRDQDKQVQLSCAFSLAGG